MHPEIQVRPESPFTVDNIPFGVIRIAGVDEPRCASAIGDYALDLVAYSSASRLDGIDAGVSFETIFQQVKWHPVPSDLVQRYVFAL